MRLSYLNGAGKLWEVSPYIVTNGNQLWDAGRCALVTKTMLRARAGKGSRKEKGRGGNIF